MWSVGSHNGTQHHSIHADLSFAVSFSQCLLTNINPNRAQSCWVFQLVSLHCNTPLAVPSTSVTLHMELPLFVSSLSFRGVFKTGHYLLCQKFLSGELHFDTEQHHLLCSTLGQGLHSQGAVTRDNTERWSWPVAFFRPFPKCHFLFVPTLSSHRLIVLQGAVTNKRKGIINDIIPLVLEFERGIQWRGFQLFFVTAYFSLLHHAISIKFNIYILLKACKFPYSEVIVRKLWDSVAKPHGKRLLMESDLRSKDNKSYHTDHILKLCHNIRLHSNQFSQVYLIGLNLLRSTFLQMLPMYTILYRASQTRQYWGHLLLPGGKNS